MSATLRPAGRGLILLAALLLTGCSAQSFLGEQPAPDLYVLRPELGRLPGAPAHFSLIVAEPDAPLGLAGGHIAIQRSPQTLDYYAGAVWEDTAPALIQRALVEGFEKSGRIAAVARDGQGLRADYLLQTDLRRFEASYATPDGAPTITVEMGVRLMRIEGRSIVAALVVHKSAAASANSVPAAAAAFDVAAGQAVEEIVGWTLKAPKPH